MPQAETIQVPLAEYQDLVKRVERLELIVSEQLPQPPTANPAPATDVSAIIKELQDEYSRYPSFSQALLAERAAELEREEAQLRSRHVRPVRTHPKGKGRTTRRRTRRASTKR